MIYKLRKKFIKICFLSFVAVFLVLFSAIFVITSLQANASLDNLADIIIENNGKFPQFDEYAKDKPPHEPIGITRESAFTTRYFTVRYDDNNMPSGIDTRSIASISEQEALQYAENAIAGGHEKGWMNNFRYRVYRSKIGIETVFINGADAKMNNQRYLFTALAVFAAGSIVVIALIIFISKRAVRPVAESYEKQKQFVTDANHELKTPLTLISTDIDIMENEIGKNEWLSDMREATGTMTVLVNRLMTLARMDESDEPIEAMSFNLSDSVAETVSAFTARAENAQKELLLQISQDIMFSGNEASIRQLTSILLDNAIKYCDENGTITVMLQGGNHPVLTVENTYSCVADIELNRLFDRFYRADKARISGVGFGIGLSIAKAIVEKHHGTITAVNVKNKAICFKATL